MTDTTYSVVPEDEAIRIRDSVRPSYGWLDALADGKMIRMAVVPKIGSGIKRRTGRNAVLRTFPDAEGGFYIWVEFTTEGEAPSEA